MKNIFVLILLLIYSKGIACDCSTPSAAIEFYEAEFVFTGKIISKKYSKNNLTYTITFQIDRHYKKNSSNPKLLKFTLKSDKNPNLTVTSCDWKVNKGEVWLVYARRYGKELLFDYYCTNSMRLTNGKIPQGYQKLLENGNLFKIDDYIYQFEDCFNDTRPLSNIDSIFKQEKGKEYDKAFTGLELLIDKKGDLMSIVPSNQLIMMNDSVFYLVKNFIIEKDAKLTEFQKDAINVAFKVKKWEIKKHRKTRVPVSYFKHLNIEYDKKEMLWKYDLR